MKKILAISSPGGHWTQLQRVTSSFDGHEVIYISTLKGYAKEDHVDKYYALLLNGATRPLTRNVCL